MNFNYSFIKVERQPYNPASSGSKVLKLNYRALQYAIEDAEGKILTKIIKIHELGDLISKKINLPIINFSLPVMKFDKLN